MTTVGDEARRRNFGRSDQTDVTGEASGALEEPEGLEWASMGLWTDLAIRSKREVLESTVSALSEALREDEHALRKSRREFRIQLVLAVLASLSSVVVSLILLVSSSTHFKSFLAALFGILIGSAGFSLGLLGNRKSGSRRRSREEELVRRVLTHELGYKRRLFEQEPEK